MRYWKKLAHRDQESRITEALKANIDYQHTISLGIPASKLDPQVFYEHAAFLKEAPLLRAYVQNPNHIGCHTMGESETFFKGTQALEREVIELLSVDVLKAEVGHCDGYIAAGGTEANIEAVWIYRNYFMEEYSASLSEIALLSSADTHYSVYKASNLLQLKSYSVPVIDDSRMLNELELDATIKIAIENGAKYFIVIANMGTTMFGSVDDPNLYVTYLNQNNVAFKIHIDGAFGGFIYPISFPDNPVNFQNPDISSVTLDAHKMLQAPYGTGVFLVRKGMMKYVCTPEARYVNGMDITLSGSRSGTNAIAVWMILFTYGPYGWFEKINKLLYRTSWLCKQLDKMQITYYRNPEMNIVTIRAKHVPAVVAQKYMMVPDTHVGEPNWYKIVLMDHVEIEHLEAALAEFTA